MLRAAQELVRSFRSHAPRVAEAHGAAYPEALAHLMTERLDQLAR